MSNISPYKSNTEHNNIRYFVNEKGIEMLFHTVEGWTATTVPGLARGLDCRDMTVSRAAKATTLEPLKMAEILTPKGLRTTTLIPESDVAAVLTRISVGQGTFKPTKENAKSLLSDFTQAGFRLAALLKLAPELVAVQAIRHIETPEQLEVVKGTVTLQEKYIQSLTGMRDAMDRQITDEARITKYKGGKHTVEQCIHGRLANHVNSNIGCPKGERSRITDTQRSQAVVLQTLAQLAIDAHPELHDWNSVNKAAVPAIDKGAKLIAGL